MSHIPWYQQWLSRQAVDYDYYNSYVDFREVIQAFFQSRLWNR